MRISRLRLLVILVSSGAFWGTAQSAEIGNFKKTCYAPNWNSGVVEPVAERNVYGQGAQSLLAFTKRMPGGRWLIEWNYDRIVGLSIPNDVLIFLFFHECAHAQYNSASEAVADCEGLVAMEADGYLSQSTYNRIRQVYNSFGREFPSGNC